MRSAGVVTRSAYGAMAGVLAAACMTIIRTAARRRGIIEKTIPQAVEEWLASRTRTGAGAHPAFHHLTDQVLHLGYGAVLGSLCGITISGRGRHTLLRGAGLGLGVWLLGSWIVLPAISAKQGPWRKRLAENAVDLAAHLAYGGAVALVTEELHAQSDRGPSSDTSRRATKVG